MTTPSASELRSTRPDPRALQLHRAQPIRDVPYVPTDEKVVDAMLNLAGVSGQDTVYDLGCGDGRIVIAAAKRGACGVGVDIDPQRVAEAQESAKRAGVSGRATFIRGSFFDIDLRSASVVTLYLLPGINVKLRPKLMSELRPGSRVISNNFDMKDWPADATDVIYYRTLYKWLIPAWVSGEWHGIIHGADKGRRRFSLQLERRYGRVSGRAQIGGHEAIVYEGRIIADQLRFLLWHPEHLRPGMQFSGRVEGAQIRGTCRIDRPDSPTLAWCGMRQSH